MLKRDLEITKKPLWEYVISGLNHTFFSFSDYNGTRPDLKKNFDELVKACRGAYNHELSVLFNAWQEKPIGRGLTSRGLRDTFKYIYADSGGLQIVTLGKELNDENKNKVYEMQGKYSDRGFCFDEIPLKLTGDRSSRVSTQDRFFDKENFDEYAIKSGKNLRQQIEYFEEHGSKCKPFLIVQGNCLETYQRWLDLVLKQIPFEKWKNIGGLASGVAALGMGKFENIDRYGILAQLEGPPSLFKHIHLLGVGGINRIVPFVAMQKNGFFPKTDVVSYDSTTHSCSMTMGLYYARGDYTSTEFRGDETTPKKALKEKILDEMEELTDLKNFDVTRGFCYESLFGSAAGFREQFGDTDEIKYKKHLVRFITILVQVLNFSEYLEHLHENRDNFMNYVSNAPKDIQQIAHLYDIKDISTYNKWLQEAKRSMSSSRVEAATSASHTLEDFF